jgi:predicted cupin superfamily sugar epimerase
LSHFFLFFYIYSVLFSGAYAFYSLARLSFKENMTMRKDELIKQLNLLPLSEEGGFVKETYRSSQSFGQGNQSRSLLTTIHYLVSEDTGGRNYLHKNKSDHILFFHCGWPLEYTIISPEKEIKKIVLGPDPNKGDVFQCVVVGGHFAAARLITERTECESFPNEIPFALTSEAVAPGFEYKDRYCCNRKDVEQLFPELSDKLREHLPPE